MPQLDIQIFFIDTFVGFFSFWFLYFYNNKVVFPEIKRSILLREVKILTWKLFFIEFISYFHFWEKYSTQIEASNKQNLLNFLEKISHVSFTSFKKYGLELFLIVENTVNNDLYINDFKKISFCKGFLERN